MARRRGPKEAAFGTDSFLDVIANLVGIVLIIIVLIGARIRSLPEVLVAEPEPAAPHAAVQGLEPDTTPDEQEITKARAEIAALQQRLAENLRRLTQSADKSKELQSSREVQRSTQARTQTEMDRQRAANSQIQATIARAEDDQRPLRERIAELEKAVKELENRPPERKQLRYHLPVSKPLSAGELLFECRQGRVTFIDLQSFLDEVRRTLPKKVEELGSRWEVGDETSPIGAFKLRYTIVRQRTGPLDQAFTGLPPAENRGFSYGLDGWEVVPVWPARGETVQDALADGSRFRQVIDASDPQTAALTFFIYPDSFELYRRLRDHLYDHGFVVAGRPLLMDAPIAGSRKGSISRGQ